VAEAVAVAAAEDKAIITMTRFSANKYLKEKKTMHSRINNGRTLSKISTGILIIAVGIMAFVLNSSALAETKQKTFSTSEEAVNDFIKALQNDNRAELLAIFGDDANDLVSSGDDVIDKERRQKFLNAYDEQHKLSTEGDKLVVVVGKNDWPFPIPLVKQEQKWVFDTNAGKEEILDRRIGQNELDTIQVMLAIVDAEREYSLKDRNANGLREYAQKFKSDPGKKNGLYWETKEGEEPSPLGPIITQAKEEGYFKNESEGPQPYHGYYYKILTAQGEHADGGAYDYIVDGNMIGGFAVVAYPADYDSSGIMTFLVNHDGVVYQKNLGDDTEKTAKAMTKYDPDETWKKAE
jgi:hypothetical protein